MIDIENWMPMSITMGPPLPKSMGIYWPWYVAKALPSPPVPVPSPPVPVPPTPSPPSLALFYMPSKMEVWAQDGRIFDMYWNCIFKVSITNRGSGVGTYSVIWKDSEGAVGEPQSVTLAGGGIYNWERRQLARLNLMPAGYTMTLKGDWVDNNIAVGTATLSTPSPPSPPSGPAPTPVPEPPPEPEPEPEPEPPPFTNPESEQSPFTEGLREIPW